MSIAHAAASPSWPASDASGPLRNFRSRDDASVNATSADYVRQFMEIAPPATRLDQNLDEKNSMNLNRSLCEMELKSTITNNDGHIPPPLSSAGVGRRGRWSDSNR